MPSTSEKEEPLTGIKITVTPSSPNQISVDEERKPDKEDNGDEDNSSNEEVRKEEVVVVEEVAVMVENRINSSEINNDNLIVIRGQEEIISEGSNVENQETPIEREIKNGKECRSSEEYPEDCNPFGDEEEEKEEAIVKDSKSPDAAQMKDYPTDLNPFGDEEEEESEKDVTKNVKEAVSVDDYDASLNPFGSDEEEEETIQSKPVTPVPAPRRSLQPQSVPSFLSSVHSHSTSSLERNKNKPSINSINCNKIPPPRPPPPVDRKLQHSDTSISLDSAKPSSLQSPASSSINSTPEKGKRFFKKKPAPRPPPVNLGEDVSTDANLSNSDIVSIDSNSVPNTPESSRRSVRSSDVGDSLSPALSFRSVSPGSELDSYTDSKSGPNSDSKVNNSIARRKKRQAPPIPIPMRAIAKGSLEEIQQELSEIGDKLVEIEKRTSTVIDTMKREGNSHRHRKLIYEYLTLAQDQCTLARKQEELSYLKREHKLEEDHADTEYKMRIIMAKPSSMKTDEDEEKEQELLHRLVEIIEERNDIVENMMKIDKRSDFNALVEKVKQIKGGPAVEPILATFMKNSYNEKNVKASDIKYTTHKLKLARTKSKHKNKENTLGKSALNTLKRMAKVN